MPNKIKAKDWKVKPKKRKDIIVHKRGTKNPIIQKKLKIEKRPKKGTS